MSSHKLVHVSCAAHLTLQVGARPKIDVIALGSAKIMVIVRDGGKEIRFFLSNLSVKTPNVGL